VGKNYFNNELKEISCEQKLEIIDKLVEGGVEYLSLLGGEPLMMKEDLFSVVEHAVSKGLKISLVSNGLLLRDRIMERVIDSGINRLVISVEGASSETHDFVRGKNTFERVVNNIKNVTNYIEKKGSPLHVNINTVLNRLNYPEIEEMIDLCRQMQVNEWTLLSMGGVGFAEDNLEKLEITPEQEIEAARRVTQKYASDSNLNGLSISPLFCYPLIHDYIQEAYGFKMPKSRICCNAAITLGFIAPDGNLYPCDRVCMENYTGFKIGDAEIRPMSLIDHSFYEIWNSDYYLNMFDLIVNENTYKYYTPCNHCKYLTNRFCNPCPLYSLDSRVAIRTCHIVEKKLGDISVSDSEFPLVNESLSSQSLTNIIEESEIDDYFTQITEKIPQKISGLRSSERGNLLIILNPYKVEYACLNLIGKVLWDFIDGKTPVQKISSKINKIADEIKMKVFKGISKHELNPLLNKKIAPFFKMLSNMGLITWR
jgi:radical SAM protein with 4Fe4S-binding SPASM domain